jgi:FMN-dependent NADH-azoreductase
MTDMRSSQALRILEVAASGRVQDSVSRMLSKDLINALAQRHGDVVITRRNLSEGVTLVDESWIEANFTAPEDRTAAHRTTLSESGKLVSELQNADVLVIGVPIYNFGVPAALKAWVDMICRARLTFRYTANGPEGLLTGKKAYLVVASGGVLVDSPVDFATPYMRQALRFIGIDDVEVIAAEQLNSKAEEAIDAARTLIANIVHTADAAALRTA